MVQQLSINLTIPIPQDSVLIRTSIDFFWKPVTKSVTTKVDLGKKVKGNDKQIIGRVI
ncbi:MAG TPA: hypothetical protein K8V56_03355 [Sporosarcina psychrophila]|uniref:Uncharacterized protein n=1 Tax=Sporosarcina psychrophila TaxID=1476 RepID=A0A921FXS6_SPOPS|nr:hypothetical protein [Sporosarcina psychrophila]